MGAGHYSEIMMGGRTRSQPPPGSRSQRPNLDPTLYSFAYVCGTVALLLVTTSIDRFGARIQVAGLDLKFPQWVALFTVIPIALVLLFALLAYLDWKQFSSGRVSVTLPALGLIVALAASLLFAVSTVAVFDGGWTTRTPDALATRTRAGGWLHLSFVTAGLSYYAHATTSAILGRLGMHRPRTPLRHWLFGTVPVFALAAFAFVLYLSV